MAKKFDSPGWQKHIEACVNTEISITSHMGNEVKLFTAVRKGNEGKVLPVCLNAHGGGGCTLAAKDELPLICKLANENDMVFINVEFRNAPETKAPGGANDMVAAINYISQHGSDHNIDTSRIAISGSSGGANICLAALIILAK